MEDFGVDVRCAGADRLRSHPDEKIVPHDGSKFRMIDLKDSNILANVSLKYATKVQTFSYRKTATCSCPGVVNGLRHGNI